ncbi:MAG: hypothetical protein ACP5JK_03025 [Candidatus Aenigmatarchaeota archaeon]
MNRIRIPLEFNKEGNRVLVTATISFSNLFIPTIFIVDTGSSETFVDEFTLSKFRIYTKSLSFDSYVIMGGTKIALYKLGKVKLIFRDINRNPVAIDFNSLKVSETAWRRVGKIYSPVSIIGLNFFLETQLALFVNPSKMEGYILDEKI